MSTLVKQLQDTPNIPTVYGFSHISIPTRDLAQSKQFFLDVLGGDLMFEGPSFARVQFDHFGIVLAPQAGGATPPTAEYPHYAFLVMPEDFMAIKQRLDAYGVPTHDPWGRQNRPHALMYFRDPSGNQFELFCPSGFTAVPLRLGHRAGGDYVIDFPSLCYSSLKSPDAKEEPLKVRPGGFNHMTLPCRDLQEGKRFFVEVFGSPVTVERPDHVTVLLGGAQVGMGRQIHGSTTKHLEHPNYRLLAKPDQLMPLKQRLESYGVPTHDVWTRNGIDAAMYFRDPSHNLWELYCERGFQGSVRQGISAGGTYAVDFGALHYEAWHDPGKRSIH